MYRHLRDIAGNPDQKGFSLMELIIVVALIGVIAAISAPRMADMVAQADFRADVRGLLGAMKITKTEAVTRNSNCAITFSTDANGFDIYTVYADPNRNFILDAGEDVLVNGVFDNAVITSNNHTANANGNPSIGFNGRGLPLRSTGGFAWGTITLENSSNRQKTARGASSRDIVLNRVGRLRIE